MTEPRQLHSIDLVGLGNILTSRIQLLLSSLSLFLALCLATLPAHATQRALLVGVSELVNQPPEIWLSAPRNDVLLMRRALLAQGLTPANITVLADGVEGAELPGASRVHQALRDLLEKSSSGDLVVLYFSGHGMRWRDPERLIHEPDGLSEHFLARDARGRLGTGRALAGDIRDTDMDRWIQAFLARNVFVWAVFDTCSATSMTRSSRAAPTPEAQAPEDEVRFRGLRAEQLATTAPEAVDPPALAIPPAPPIARARYVAFFASESHQVTPELKLPRGDRNAAPHGLLTWAVAESLARKPATWRDLFSHVINLYPPVIEELERRFPSRELPSPVAEGALDVPLLTNAAPSLTTAPQWLAQRIGAKLTIPAGELDGLEPGIAVRISVQSPSGRVSHAVARVINTDASVSQVNVPPALAAQHAGSSWIVSPQEMPRGAMLRVAGAIDAVGGISLEYPASIELSSGQPGDLHIERADSRFKVTSALNTAVEFSTKEQLGGFLQSAAVFRWLDRLTELASNRRIEGFSANLQLLEGERLLRTVPLQGAPNPPRVATGQRLAVEVLNQSGSSVDLRIVGVDARGRRYDIYPTSSAETNRFESGSRDRPTRKSFELPAELSQSGGRIALVAAPARPITTPRLFGVSPSFDLTDVRVRGQLTAARERQVQAASLRW
ncbi:caspase family protein [bacterium BD-1]|nr:caspase family protein [Ottowia caeni]